MVLADEQLSEMNYKTKFSDSFPASWRIALLFARKCLQFDRKSLRLNTALFH
jgi:hypothetical protein